MSTRQKKEEGRGGKEIRGKREEDKGGKDTRKGIQEEDQEMREGDLRWCELYLEFHIKAT